MSRFPYQKRLCVECPWRRSTPVGKFSADKYRELAGTAEDMSQRVFTCHMTPEHKPNACAGWIQQQGGHNLTIRMALIGGSLDLSEIEAEPNLYANYREIAIANGVDEDDPALEDIRNDGQMDVGPRE
jgi:hypothetical protein